MADPPPPKPFKGDEAFNAERERIYEKLIETHPTEVGKKLSVVERETKVRAMRRWWHQGGFVDERHAPV